MPRRSSRRLVAAATALLVLAVAGATALLTADVVARGKLVPSGGPGVRRIRVWDAFEFYVSSETARPGADAVVVIVLAMAAAILGFSALVLARAGSRGRTETCLALAAAGLAYLAADEGLAIHESLGHNLQLLRNLPGVERPDDVVLALYLVPALAFAVTFRRVLLGVPIARAAFAAGLVCVALAIGFDLAGRGGTFEEGFELLAAALLGSGLLVVAVAAVDAALRDDATRPAPPAAPAR